MVKTETSTMQILQVKRFKVDYSAKKAGYEIVGKDELSDLDIDAVSKYSAKFFPNDATSTRYSHKTGIQSYKLNFASDVKRYLLDEANFLEENEEKEISLFNMKFLIKR